MELITKIIEKFGVDKVKHLKVGVVLTVAVIVLVLISKFSPPLAIAAGGTGACYFVEWYQRKRGQGTFERADFVFGAAPSWVAALLWKVFL